jgi:hypothetical protein
MNFDLIPCLSFPLIPAEGNVHLIATKVPVSGGLQDNVNLQTFCFSFRETAASLFQHFLPHFLRKLLK